MNNRLLTGIPVLYNGETFRKSIESVVNECDVLIIDNNSTHDVKLVIDEYDKRPNVFVIRNKENNFVVAAWNQILQFFLKWNYENLIIMNSDLILNQGWSNHLENGVSCVINDGSEKQDKEVFSGTPGIYVNLNVEMAKAVYPVPNDIKLWFSDDWIYTIIRELGYKTIVKHKLIGLHYCGGSQSIAILPNKSETIEADKVAWAEVVEPLMWERINKLKNEMQKQS